MKKNIFGIVCALALVVGCESKDECQPTPDAATSTVMASSSSTGGVGGQGGSVETTSATGSGGSGGAQASDAASTVSVGR